MKTMISVKTVILTLLILMLLACGSGGGGDSAPAPPSTPNIVLSRSAIDFAGVVLNNSSDQTVEIRNTGSANCIIGQILPPNGPFSISTDACSNATLTPSQSCSLRVRFSPPRQGPFVSAFFIPSNDPDSSSVNISLNGEGYGLNVWINQVNATCPNISADVTVINPITNVPLSNLGLSNFTLRQNSQLQNINNVSLNQTPTPVSLVLALDQSVSTEGVIFNIQQEASAFISSMRAGDYAAICKFNSVIEFSSSSFTPCATGIPVLNSYIISPFNMVLGTYLYDAVNQSIDRAYQLAPTPNKRAVIVLSDGVDDGVDVNDPGSDSTLDQVILYARQTGIPVFTIYYVDPNYQGGNYGNTQVLQRLATDTGGQYYNSNTTDLSAIFQQISNILNNKYTINYTSPVCSSAVSLDIRVFDSGGLYGQDTRTINIP